MKASFEKYTLKFKQPILTSRGAMAVKNGYFITLEDDRETGVGECSFIEGLSCDNLLDYEAKLKEVCTKPEFFIQHINQLQQSFPSICFGLETALLSLSVSNEMLFRNEFSLGKKGIPINGLVWMGSASFLQQQIEEKINAGFNCIKMKVGALDFATECNLIEGIRKQYAPSQIEIRLDANGAFKATDVFEKLKTLSAFDIHSIEQPIQPKQWQLMREVVAAQLIPIALDEELIGVYTLELRRALLSQIKPDYIILKPSLLGGLAVCNEWIALAEAQHIQWWATSALESNVGLNAIAMWVAEKHNLLPQGLGTGSLYLNNTASKLYIKNGALWNRP